MLGFMVVTAFISMWITNTATTAMMTPIMEAVLKQLDKESHEHETEENEENGKSNEVILNEDYRNGNENLELKAAVGNGDHVKSPNGIEVVIARYIDHFSFLQTHAKKLLWEWVNN